MILQWTSVGDPLAGRGSGGRTWPAAVSVIPGTGHIRVTQLPREAVEQSDQTLLHVTQLPREAVEASDQTKIRATQIPLEVLEVSSTTKIRVTQVSIEVVYPFRCGDVPPPSPIVPHTVPIRRLRRTPVLTEREFWLFYDWLELDLQTGVLPAGQTHAIITLRWSNDGGHTWTEPLPVDVGPAGSYAFRALWRRLGRARDRVFEVSMTDPILWAIVAARLGIVEGTS